MEVACIEQPQIARPWFYDYCLRSLDGGIREAIGPVMPLQKEFLVHVGLPGSVVHNSLAAVLWHFEVDVPGDLLGYILDGPAFGIIWGKVEMLFGRVIYLPDQAGEIGSVHGLVSQAERMVHVHSQPLLQPLDGVEASLFEDSISHLGGPPHLLEVVLLVFVCVLELGDPDPSNGRDYILVEVEPFLPYFLDRLLGLLLRAEVLDLDGGNVIIKEGLKVLFLQGAGLLSPPLGGVSLQQRVDRSLQPMSELFQTYLAKERLPVVGRHDALHRKLLSWLVSYKCNYILKALLGYILKAAFN